MERQKLLPHHPEKDRAVQRRPSITRFPRGVVKFSKIRCGYCRLIGATSGICDARQFYEQARGISKFLDAKAKDKDQQSHGKDILIPTKKKPCLNEFPLAAGILSKKYLIKKAAENPRASSKDRTFSQNFPFTIPPRAACGL